MLLLCRIALFCCVLGVVLSTPYQTEDKHVSDLARRLRDLRQRIQSLRQSTYNAEVYQYVEKLARELISAELGIQGQYNPPKANGRPKPALSQREWTFLYDGGARATGSTSTPVQTTTPTNTPLPSNLQIQSSEATVEGNTDSKNSDSKNTDSETSDSKKSDDKNEKDDKESDEKNDSKEGTKTFKCGSMILTLLKNGEVSVRVGED